MSEIMFTRTRLQMVMVDNRYFFQNEFTRALDEQRKLENTGSDDSGSQYVGRLNAKFKFLFWGSVSCCVYFIKVIRRIVPHNNSSRCLVYIITYIIIQNSGSLVSEVTS
jgi:hypothetical protein